MKLTNSIQVFNIDCMEYMAGLKDNAFDLAIVDPPFGIGMHKQIGKKKGAVGDKWDSNEWDNGIPDKEYFNELFRVSKNQMILGGNYFDLPPSRGFVVWDKVQRIDQADCEFVWSSFDRSARIYTYPRSNLQGFRNPDRFHPTEKPVGLYEFLLINFANEGDRIFDSHLGSGSSAIACHNYGYEFVGCELDEDYFNDMVKRFRQVTSQTTLF